MALLSGMLGPVHAHARPRADVVMSKAKAQKASELREAGKALEAARLLVAVVSGLPQRADTVQFRLDCAVEAALDFQDACVGVDAPGVAVEASFFIAAYLRSVSAADDGEDSSVFDPQLAELRQIYERFAADVLAHAAVATRAVHVGGRIVRVDPPAPAQPLLPTTDPETDAPTPWAPVWQRRVLWGSLGVAASLGIVSAVTGYRGWNRGPIAGEIHDAAGTYVSDDICGESPESLPLVLELCGRMGTMRTVHRVTLGLALGSAVLSIATGVAILAKRREHRRAVGFNRRVLFGGAPERHGASFGVSVRF